MEKINKIAITGASGVGKTTMAEFIAKEFNLPFISASAREVWPQFGFKNHQEALQKCLSDVQLGREYQIAIWEQRSRVLGANTSFVTDRSPIDNYAYFLLQQGYNSPSDNNILKGLCQKDYDNIDAIIFIDVAKGMEIEDNGRRIVNLSYQRMVSRVIRMVLEEEFEGQKNSLYLHTWDFSERISQVKNFIQEIS